MSLSIATHTGIDFYMNLPVRELVELNNEVAEEYERMNESQ